MKEGQRKKEIMLYVQIAVVFIVTNTAIILWSSYDWLGIPAKHSQMSPSYEEFAVHIASSVSAGQHLDYVDSLEYGDVVYYVFESVFVKSDKENLFFSRVVGLPGDTIGIQDGKLIRNGSLVDQSYIPQPNLSDENLPEVLIPRDHVYLLNDKRNIVGKYFFLSDSRHLGPISMFVIKGVLGRD
ncbi:signal peptidase I [Candidatus Uabimicrobium sp. HlEnr_7]|uniref:signal peptidase I n=1 Tax=Candidatus Uabimicrobium helgolandensis TaxID=3095367 RepID=UPI0035576C7C